MYGIKDILVLARDGICCVGRRSNSKFQASFFDPPIPRVIHVLSEVQNFDDDDDPIGLELLEDDDDDDHSHIVPKELFRQPFNDPESKDVARHQIPPYAFSRTVPRTSRSYSRCSSASPSPPPSIGRLETETGMSADMEAVKQLLEWATPMRYMPEDSYSLDDESSYSSACSNLVRTSALNTTKATTKTSLGTLATMESSTQSI